MSRTDVHKKPRRGIAARDRQLSQRQRWILIWLEAQEWLSRYWDETSNWDHSPFKDDLSDMKPSVKLVKSQGTRWTAKQFYGCAPTRAQESALAKAISALEKRELIVLKDIADGIGKKRRTTYVKLTKSGVATARSLIENFGMSERELVSLQPHEVCRRRDLWNLRLQLQRRTELVPLNAGSPELFRSTGGTIIAGKRVVNLDQWYAENGRQISFIEQKIQYLENQGDQILANPQLMAWASSPAHYVLPFMFKT